MSTSKNEYLPLCYRFSFDISTTTIFLKIQKWIVPYIQDLLRNETRLMDYMYSTYGGDKEIFMNFGEKEMDFGWKNSIKWHSENENEITYSYTLLPTKIQTDEICDDCKGTKINFFKQPCYECRESGKKYIHSEHSLRDGMLSLYPLMRFANGILLGYCARDNKEDLPSPPHTEKQIIVISWSDTTGMHNCSVSAWTDDAIPEWIKKINDEDTFKIKDAMAKAEEVLFVRKVDPYYFRIETYGEDFFGLQVPGNACTLGTSSSGMGMFGSIGQTLHPHNVDTSLQQIEFIVGLATMGDLYEKSLT